MKRALSLFLITISVIIVLIACNSEDISQVQEETWESENLTESGMPIVNETLTLNFFTAKSDVNVPHDWNELMMWNEYEEMTNINVNWDEQVSMDALEERRNLALVNEFLPDVFYASGLSNIDLYKYGQQGAFIELNNLIDNHAPNLKALLDENPEILKGLTFPDGKIYSLPTIREEDFLSLRIGAMPWYNKEWLDNLNMEVPETLDEFYDYLKAVKTENPSGDPDLNEVPYGGTNIDGLVDFLRGSFGIGNKGDGNLDTDPDSDELRFIPVTDAYKEMLEYIHMLFDEGLIQQNIYSIGWEQYMADGAEGKYGVTLFWDPAHTFADGDDQYEYVGGSALKGPHGDQIYSSITSSLSDPGSFVITKDNPDPAASIRWIDYFYSDEGARLIYMGIEDETFVKTEKGMYEYIDEIKQTSHRESAIAEYIPWVGTNPPGIVKQDYFIGSETSEATLATAEKIEPYIPEVVWPNFTYTEDENNFLSSVGNDIEQYVSEQRDRFIVGELSFDKWDQYIETLEDMGLDEYMEVHQSAYERYMNAD